MYYTTIIKRDYQTAFKKLLGIVKVRSFI